MCSKRDTRGDRQNEERSCTTKSAMPAATSSMPSSIGRPARVGTRGSTMRRHSGRRIRKGTGWRSARTTLAAAISLVRYDENYAFLGFYITAPDFRRQGIGSQMWQQALAAAGQRIVGLDGVVAEQENYRRSGFVLAHANIRYGGIVDVGRASGYGPGGGCADPHADADRLRPSLHAGPARRFSHRMAETGPDATKRRAAS